ncbi:MAG: tetratricopeptide repeat protein [Chloroherpetonaceae bacterium]|nr:tetratricopeptide repeat protein [Chthonomonadaceae bacterium]MDW8206605.1 tetratricopeptide repeat protein [Chloroherpetonaceae bacterium]
MAAESKSHSTERGLRGLYLRLKHWFLPVGLIVLLVDAGYLFIANRASGPPRVELSAFAYQGALLLHLLLGIALAWRAARGAVSFFRTIAGQGAVTLFGGLAGIAMGLCLLTGLAFLGFGFGWLPLQVRPGLRLAHNISTGAMLAFGLIALLLRAWKARADAPERVQARTAVRLGLALGVPFVGLLLYTLYAPNTDRRIVNPHLPPMTVWEEGDGKGGKFFPASVQTVGNRFFPSEYYTDSQSCGVTGCHPDIYAQWNESAHHLSSFNNPWYRKAIEYMQEVVGVQPSKWCGGCHDMAVLQTEDPQNPGKSRFDRPIKTQVWPPEKFPESHAGIGCAACHSIVHVKSTMGVSDFTADYPPMHKYLVGTGPLMKQLHNFLTRLAPEPHKKTFLRPFHRDETAKFCSTCHKVHLDKSVNDYRWIRGQNEYDAWQGSGVSGYGAASFYYPTDEKTGQPAFKKCADCHMPKVRSNDAGNKGGYVKSHRFPGANTALPTVYGHKNQLEETIKFLTDGALTIDIFGIVRETGRKTAKAPAGAPKTHSAAMDTPKAGSFSGDADVTNIKAATTPIRDTVLYAPINRGGKGVALRRGESPLIEVVVRTKKLGHAFPGGTIDAFDCWVELEAKDETGRVFFHSGKLQWPNGPVEEGAERYRTLVVDAKARKIDKRNVWAIRGVVYTKVIPPGAADVVHYRVKVPKDIGKKVTLTARLNYRKFEWYYNFFTYLGRTAAEEKPSPKPAGWSSAVYGDGSQLPIGLGLGKKDGPVGHGWDTRPIYFDADMSIVSGNIKDVPVIPVVVLAENTVTLPVVGENEPLESPTTPVDEKVDRIRWNDYGIGLLLQGNLKEATRAFQKVTEISPKWPEGYVNLGRVRQVERDTPAAQEAFRKAFALYDAHPTPMTPYLRARTQFLYAQSQFDRGDLDGALQTLAEVRKIFPDDRNVRNMTGIVLFRRGRYDEAIQHFRHTLSIDPEDIAAHYNLMKCYRGKNDLKTAAIHEKLYKRFKADETSTRLSGEYRRNNPADNNLAQPIHEIGDAICRPKPAWLLEYERRSALKALQSGIGRRRAGLHPDATRVAAR